MAFRYLLTRPRISNTFWIWRKLKCSFNFFALPDDFSKFPVGAMRKNQNQICKKCREKCPIRHYLAMIQTSNSDWGDKPWYYHLLTKLTAKCHKSLRICRLDMTREGICMYIHTRVSSYPLPCRRRFRKLLGEKLFLLFFGISRNPFCLYSLSSSF